MARHPDVQILGYSEAAAYLATEAGRTVRAVIAIAGRYEYGVVTDATVRRLQLHFDDIDVPDKTDPLAAARQAIRQREFAAIGRVGRPPTEDDVRAVLAFAESIRDEAGVLLCHCLAGISRSPAVAALCLAVWLGAGYEDECLRTVRRIRPAAQPHPGLISMGDRLLGRGGRLIAALQPEPDGPRTGT